MRDTLLIVLPTYQRSKGSLTRRNGKPAAALVPIDEYKALEETAEILSNPDAIAAIEAGLAERERDETVALEDLRRQRSAL